MGISSRFIRKFLAHKFFVFGAWCIALLPWALWWGLHTTTGQDLFIRQVNTYINTLYPNTSLVWTGVALNPSRDVHISSLSLYGSTQQELFSVDNFHMEWGIKKGIVLDIDSINVEIDSSLWEEFSAQEESSSSDVFSWDYSLGSEIPFSFRFPNIILKKQEEEMGNLQYTMSGSLSNSIDIDDLYVGLQWNEIPEIELRGALSYIGTNVKIEGMDISTKGGDFFIEGFVDASTTDIKMQGRVRLEEKGLSPWINKDIPGTSLSMQYSLSGDSQKATLTGEIEGEGALGVAFEVRPLEQRWDISLHPKSFLLSALAPSMMEKTIVNGTYRLYGNGFSMDRLSTNIDIHGEKEVLWGQSIPKWSTESRYQSSRLDIANLTVEHALGNVEAGGMLDIGSEQGEVKLKVVMSNMEELLEYGVRARGEISYEGGVELIWKDGITAITRGVLSGRNLVYEEYQLRELMSDIDIDYQGGNIEGDVSVEAFGFDGAGLTIDELVANQHMYVGENQEIKGDISLYGLRIPGTVLVEKIQGSNAIDGQEDISFEGVLENMTLFEKGATYDKGVLIAQLQGDGLHSSLTIFEQDESILDVAVLGDQKKGVWKLERFRFHPLKGMEWKQETPSTLELRDGSVHKGSVHLTSKAGELHVDLVRDRGTLGLLGVDAAQMQDIATHILGEDLLGADVQGQIFADIQWNQMQLEGTIDVVELMYAEYAQGLSIKTSIHGEWEKPTIHVHLEGKTPLMDIETSIPLNSTYGLDCSRFGSLRVQVPAQNLLSSQEVIPILPQKDISFGGILTAEKSLCNPSLELAMNGVVPLGEEKILLEGTVTRKSNNLEVHTYVLRDYAPKLTLIGDVQGDYNTLFDELVESGTLLEWDRIVENMDLRLNSIDFSLARLLRLMDIDGNVKGMLHASIAIGGHPQKPDVEGRIWLEEAFMGGVELQSPELSIRADEEYWVEGSVAFQEGFATLAGVIPREMDSISLTMNSDAIPLKAVLGIVPDTNQVQGSLSVNGNVQGPFDALTHSIRVQIDEGSVSYLPLNISISDMELDTLLDTDQILISSCSMNSGSLRSKEKGKASLQGTLRKEGMSLRSGNLQLNLDQFWLMDRSDQSYRFTGDLLARYMSKGVFDVSGSILLNHGKILLDSGFFSDESTLSISPKIQVYRPDAQFSSVVETLDEGYGFEISKIDIDLNQQLYLTAEFPLLDDYNKQLSVLSTAYVDGIFDGDITLSMDEESISMEGNVYALRGDLKAMGAMFAISNANLSFFGRDYYNPIMDIQAVRTIDNYEVVTTLTGSVASPQIAFSSTSSDPLSQTDIISLILFGRVSSELGDNNPLLSSVMTSLSGSMNQLIGSSLVDRFSWDPSSQQIEIGMSLSEKLYLSITQVYQGENQDIQSQTMIGLEFFILKRMYMELQSNPSTGSLSGYVFQRWRY